MASLPSQQLLVKAFNEISPQTKIIVLSFQYPFTSTRYRWKGNEVIPFNGKNRSGLLRLYVWVRVWFTLLGIRKRSKDFGLLSFWFSECAFVGKKFAKKYKLKHYIWISGQDAKKSNQFANRVKVTEDELIAMSDFLVREFYYHHHVMPGHMIPNAIDESIFPVLSPLRDIDIIGVGSLIQLKQFEIFVDVIDCVRRSIPTVKAVICGDGPLRSVLQQKIDILNLQENLTIIGAQTHPATLALMQRSKILLHPSAYEGLSTACLEALYAGSYVVSLVRSMAKPIEKWSIAKSTEDMIEKVLKILYDPEPRFHRVHTFSMHDSAKKILELYQNPVIHNLSKFDEGC